MPDPSIYGQLNTQFNGLGQLGAIRDQMAARAAQQQRGQLIEQQIRSGQALEDERRTKATAAQRLADSTKTIDGLMQGAMVQDPDTGIFTFDRAIAEQGIVKSGEGHRLPEYLQHFDALDKSTREAAEKRNGSIAKALMVVTTAGNTPGAALGMAAYLKKNRLMSDADLEPVLAALAEDDSPANVAAIVTKYGAAIPQYQDLLRADETRSSTLAKTTADTAHTTAQTAKLTAETAQIGKPPEPKNLDEALFAAIKAKDGPEQRRLLNLKGESNAAGRAPEREPRQTLTPNAEATLTRQLVKQWTDATKPARDLDRQVALIDAGMTAARRGDLAQGAQTVLVAFQKILDPTSVVRESEFDRSAAGQSLLNRVRGAYEKLAVGGAGIPIGELEKFHALAKEAATAQRGSYLQSVKERIGRGAARYNIPGELIFEAQLDAEPTAPAALTKADPLGIR